MFMNTRMRRPNFVKEKRPKNNQTINWPQAVHYFNYFNLRSIRVNDVLFV